MTSVKELGKSIKKQRSDLEPDGREADEEVGISPSGAAYAALLVVAGCLALGVGAFLASVLVVAPELAWIADNLQRMGITSGAVLAGGVTLLGLGLVCKAIARAHRSLSGHMRKENGVAALADSQEELRDGLDKVQFELRVLHESTRQLLEIAHEQTLKRSSNHPDDAMLQLAASLDQLGARLEDRLESQHTGLERRLGTLDGAIEETRRRITKWLEESQRMEREARAQSASAARAAAAQAQANARAQANAQPQATAKAQPAANAQPALPAQPKAPIPAPGAPAAARPRPARPGPEATPRAPERKTVQPDDLHVLVTLEEELAAAQSRPEEDGEVGPDNSLGLLDQIGDFNRPAAAGGARREAASPEGERQRMVPEPSEAKLAQLKSLLADHGLRQALEGLQRDPEAGA